MLSFIYPPFNNSVSNNLNMLSSSIQNYRHQDVLDPCQRQNPRAPGTAFTS